MVSFSLHWLWIVKDTMPFSLSPTVVFAYPLRPCAVILGNRQPTVFVNDQGHCCSRVLPQTNIPRTAVDNHIANGTDPTPRLNICPVSEILRFCIHDVRLVFNHRRNDASSVTEVESV